MISLKYYLLVGLLLVFISCNNQNIKTDEEIETIEVEKEKQSEAIRGVWLTNVASKALFSRENITKAVEKCDELGFNTIFVVTWNAGYTIYPSTVAEQATGKKIHPDFEGRDPLQELIEEAKKKDIKIFAWFEYGFASSYKDDTGGNLIERNPHWASKDSNGKITEKNGFQWLNPFHHKVQGFIKNLLLEATKNYDLAGIQGDDRLPALPSNGGYSIYTDSLYKSEHGGQAPPKYEKDYDWIKWRSAKLTAFLKDLVESLKAEKPDLIVSMAPSIYPWSEENYLQDWPAWLRMGLVDLVIPQVYRYDIEKYKREMDKIYSEQISEHDKTKVIPGVLLQVDDYNPNEQFLSEMVDYNRSKGIEGEVYFFYEGISKYESFFKKSYLPVVSFPQLK